MATDAALTILDMLLECQRLIIHMRIHSGYRQNGYEKMTAKQQRLFDAIWQESENILEGAAMEAIVPARCPECDQLLPETERNQVDGN